MKRASNGVAVVCYNRTPGAAQVRRERLDLLIWERPARIAAKVVYVGVGEYPETYSAESGKWTGKQYGKGRCLLSTRRDDEERIYAAVAPWPVIRATRVTVERRNIDGTTLQLEGAAALAFVSVED